VCFYLPLAKFVEVCYNGIVDRFAYDTYGKQISHTGNSFIIFGYNGRDGVITDANGLLYMKRGAVMKKIIVFIMIIFCMVLLSSCKTEKRGVEQHSPNNSSYELCGSLIPNELLEFYEYEDGNYYYYSNEAVFKPAVEKVIMNLTYSEDEYANAKNYILHNMNLDFENTIEHNGYVFYINLSYYNTFPTRYNMVAINDEKRTLVFFGSLDFSNQSSKDEYKSDFGKYLKDVFGEYYSFE